uniref:L1332.3a protein n=1 Tax=Oryza sativa TaxID=4530 RepID=Q9SC75_ORYSA|nr:l1332.3a [Oryza sativa Indica Group]
MLQRGADNCVLQWSMARTLTHTHTDREERIIKLGATEVIKTEITTLMVLVINHQRPSDRRAHPTPTSRGVGSRRAEPDLRLAPRGAPGAHHVRHGDRDADHRHRRDGARHAGGHGHGSARRRRRRRRGGGGGGSGDRRRGLRLGGGGGGIGGVERLRELGGLGLAAEEGGHRRRRLGVPLAEVLEAVGLRSDGEERHDAERDQQRVAEISPAGRHLLQPPSCKRS